MQPAARVAGAIEVLNDILSGVAPEKALTGWGRAHRFAGSKDRAAIRDHVFDALRCRASYGWVGGSDTGRGIMLGWARQNDVVDQMFSGEGHAPAVVGDEDAGQPIGDAPRDVRLDMPAWLLPHFDGALGKGADGALATLQTRASVFLRVNTAKCTREDAVDALAAVGCVARPVGNIKNALQVVENERRIAQSGAYLNGWVELQDASSQAAVDALPITPGMRILDFCAGGGGKSLAMAARGAQVSAFDIDPRRMVDIAPRAARAGVEIEVLTQDALHMAAPFDLVLVDAPCSGSGTWRRTPLAKWDLTADRLAELNAMQDDVLSNAKDFVRAGGGLVYATCSVFEIENTKRIQAFIGDSSDFELGAVDLKAPSEQGDGFFFAQMMHLG